jgi:peroxiredoxin Q/BCP
MKTIRNSVVLLSAVAFIFAAQSSRATHLPEVGDKAPRVYGYDQDGKKWKLADEIGKNIIVLYFYPRDNTPGCTKEACGFRDRMSNLKAEGVKVIGVSFDSVNSHKSFVFKYDLDFPLISDPKGEIADTYGARKSPHINMDRRISFLIGMNGRIVHITDSPDPAVQLEENERAIKNLTAKSSM